MKIYYIKGHGKDSKCRDITEDIVVYGGTFGFVVAMCVGILAYETGSLALERLAEVDIKSLIQLKL